MIASALQFLTGAVGGGVAVLAAIAYFGRPIRRTNDLIEES